MAESMNWTWDEGSDLTMSIVYNSGPSGAEVPVDLSLYKFRMDIAASDGNVLTVLNDEAITDTDPFAAGSQTDNAFEVTLGSAGQIGVTLSRALTLPGGAFYKYISSNPAVTDFSYDMFLRDTSNKQKKIMFGTITVRKSVTKWV